MSLLFLPAAKVAELSMPKLSVSISRVSVEGLKLVILSADLLLNFVGEIMAALSVVVSGLGELLKGFSHQLSGMN